MKSIKAGMAALAASALLLAGCSDDASQAQDGDETPFNFLFIGGVTGPAGPTTETILLGLQAAADDINASGGVDGRMIEITTMDSNADPTQAVSQLQRALTSGTRPDLIYPGTTSGETLALLPLLTREELWSMSQTASPAINIPDDYPFHFGISLSKTDEYAVMSTVIESTGAQRIGMLASSDAYGDASVAALEASVADLGADLFIERYDADAVDLTTQYQRVLSNDPDYIWLDSSGGDPVPRLFSAREAAGGLDTPVWVSNGVFTAGAPADLASEAALEECTMPGLFTYTVHSDPLPENILPLAEAVESDKPGVSIYAPGLAYDLLRVGAYAASQSTDGTTGPVMAEVMQSLDLPDGYSIIYGSNLEYTAESHFPQPSDGVQLGVDALPCAAAVTESGFWQEN